MENVTEELGDDGGTLERLGDDRELDGKSERSTNYLGMKGMASRRTGGLERETANAESGADPENVGDSLAMTEKDYKALATNDGCSETVETTMRRLSREGVL